VIVATRLSSPKSTQFIAWTVRSKGSVPEGQNDRSQFIAWHVSKEATRLGGRCGAYPEGITGLSLGF
jgi:hypothetical protein